MTEECRLCGCEGEDFVSIFDSGADPSIKSNSYAEEAMMCARILIHPGDGLTEAICKRCISQLVICKKFRIQCELTDIRLRRLKIPSRNEKTNETTDKETVLVKNEIIIDDPEDRFENFFEEDKTTWDKFVKDEDDLNVKEEKVNLLSQSETSDANRSDHEECEVAESKSPLKSLKFFSRKIDSKIIRHSENTTLSNGYMCDQCGRRFTQKGNLLFHLKGHVGLKTFHCNICKNTFSRKSHLVTHMRIHDDIKPAVCEICGRSFRKSSDLSRHKRIHFDAKDFACAVCDRKFKRSGDVISHMRSHTGDRPYKCMRCGKSYTSRSSLKKHLLTQDSCGQSKLNIKITQNPKMDSGIIDDTQ